MTKFLNLFQDLAHRSMNDVEDIYILMLLLSPAKLNIFLHVIGRRQDGYHLLQSLFVPLSLSDELTIVSHEVLEVDMPGADISENIALKAALVLREHAGVDFGAKITIGKRIPIAAGLGGSSTNAATVLLGLNALWGLGLSLHTLKEIATKLGADVPYFLDPRPMFVEGIGEKLTPVALDIRLHVVIVYPGFGMLASDVYRRGVSKYSEPIDAGRDRILWAIQHGENALEGPAIRLNYKIGELMAEIRFAKGCNLARMSGSGSACFGIFADKNSALAAMDMLGERYFVHYEEVAL